MIKVKQKRAVVMKPADNELGGKCSILAGGGLFLFATGPH
jgi:hypothetical protein